MKLLTQEVRRDDRPRLLKAMRVTLRNALKAPFTIQYPDRKVGIVGAAKEEANRRSAWWRPTRDRCQGGDEHVLRSSQYPAEPAFPR